ncbi:MAG: HEAT repeat domain-containing protein [Planctomycetota bacterium]|nr:HEAT repeat domain-containing protein [Planctomycetota bacterium]
MPRSSIRRAFACALLSALLAVSSARAEEDPPPPLPPQPGPEDEEPPPKKIDEPELRRTFMQAFTSAAKPEDKAESVYLLKGVREKASLKLLTGLLGDSLPTVRRNACRVMSETPDPEGYFVKPLTAVLYDRNFMVRASAAEALATAKVKAQAVKALVFALTQSAQEGVKLASYAQTLNTTLSKITGKQFGKTDDLTKLAQWWNEYLQENERALTQADEKYLKSLDPGAEPAGKTAAPEAEAKSPAPKAEEKKSAEVLDE